MKYVLFAFAVILVSQSVYANRCAEYFDTNIRAVEAYEQLLSEITLTSFKEDMKPVPAKDILITVFRILQNAKSRSTVYIFTPEIKDDGIGAALVSMLNRRMYESSDAQPVREKDPETGFFLTKADRVHFDIHVNGLFSGKLLNFIANNALASVRSLSIEQSREYAKTHFGTTLILAETSRGLEYVMFSGGLHKFSLKEEGIEKLKIMPPGFPRLDTSPFKNQVPFTSGVLTEGAAEFLLAARALSEGFKNTPTPVSDIDVAQSTELKAFELVTYLYYVQFKKKPQPEWGIRRILDETLAETGSSEH